MSCLPLLAILISGCGDRQAPAQPAGQAAQEQPGDRETARAEPASAVGDDVAPGQEIVDQESSNPLIRGFRNLLGSNPIIEDDSELQQGLMQADSILREIKEENRQALRDLNRQIPHNSQRQPNLVLLVAHGLGYGELGCYGQNQFRTPALDRLASEGIRLNQFYSGGTSATAGQWCLMTGYDTSRAVRGDQSSYRIIGSHITLGEVMWQAGYKTVFVGRWLVGNGTPSDLPHLHGFDRWLGTMTGDILSAYPETIWSDGAQIRLRGNADGKRGVHAQQLYTEEVVEFLATDKRERPFCVIVSLPCPDTTGGDEAIDGSDDWTEAERDRATAIARLDRNVGEIIHAIDLNGLRERTAVFFTSDVGPSPQDGLREEVFGRTANLNGSGGELYEGGIRVPLIARWPSRIAPGTVSEQPGTTWDLLPTFATISGANRRPPSLDGESLLPILQGGKGSDERLLYWESRDAGFAQAVRRGEWKVVRPPGKMDREDVELYNLEKDPEERINVAKENPDVLTSFLKG